MSEVILKIHDLSRGGSGVGKLDSGAICFVPFTAPGDQVRVRVIEQKKNYAQGELIEILEPSPIRVKAPCELFQKCGGCAWQHLPYELQFQTKKSGLLHALKRAGIDASQTEIDEMPAQNTYYYRNRIQLHGHASDRKLGFYAPKSKQILDLSHCTIAKKEINQKLNEVRHQGFKEQKEEFKVELDELDGQVRVAWNKKHAALGFRQVNDEQNAVLKAWVKRALHGSNPEHDVLFDLFGGSGNLSLELSSQYLAIECVDIGAPKEPLAHQPENVQFHRMSVDRFLQKLEIENRQSFELDCIVDPPREGLGESGSTLAQAIIKLQPRTLVWVGCDVDSFTRDIHRFIKKGYILRRLGVLDLFPQTPLIESLAILTRQ